MSSNTKENLNQNKIHNNKKFIKHLDYIFEKLDIDDYEDVYKVTNKKTNLNAIIAIHNTSLGTALGGTRIQVYETFDQALTDVLRLSRGMSFKSAISEVGFGGAKSVIILKNKQDKTDLLLKSFGEAVDFLNGKYICSEDMGCTSENALTISEKTKYIVGLPSNKSSGNPSKFTAWGVLKSIQATLKKLYGSPDVKGKKIAIQGIGSVGIHLIEHLFWLGADLIITDIDQKKLEMLRSSHGVKIVDPKDIYKQQCDIFAPCAMGGIINDETIEELNCKAVCGAANNQLLEDRHCQILRSKNILYAPDFVVNGGGLINVSFELDKHGYDSKKSRDKITKIYDVLLEIYKIAEENDITTHDAAIKLAKFKMESGIGIKRDKLYFHHREQC